MSRSRNDRKGKRIAGEILGRSCFDVVGDRLIKRCGGEEVGSPISKKDAKREVSRLRRRRNSDTARMETEVFVLETEDGLPIVVAKRPGGDGMVFDLETSCGLGSPAS